MPPIFSRLKIGRQRIAACPMLVVGFNAERPATDEMADAFPPAVDGATGLR
jgi:hypothetical protein